MTEPRQIPAYIQRIDRLRVWHAAGKLDWRMYIYYKYALTAATFEVGEVLPMWRTLRRWYRAELRHGSRKAACA